MRVAGDHSDVVASKDVDQVEELLGHQRLDGGGVVAALAGGHGHEHHADRDQRLARPRGRAQDDVAARGQREQGFFLVRPGLDAASLNPFEEAAVCVLRGEPGLRLLAVGRFPPAGSQCA